MSQLKGQRREDPQKAGTLCASKKNPPPETCSISRAPICWSAKTCTALDLGGYCVEKSVLNGYLTLGGDSFRFSEPASTAAVGKPNTPTFRFKNESDCGYSSMAPGFREGWWASELERSLGMPCWHHCWITGCAAGKQKGEQRPTALLCFSVCFRPCSAHLSYHSYHSLQGAGCALHFSQNIQMVEKCLLIFSSQLPLHFSLVVYQGETFPGLLTYLYTDFFTYVLQHAPQFSVSGVLFPSYFH